MAIYDYKCERCGEIQIEQKLGADALTTCPQRLMHLQGRGTIVFCRKPVQRLVSGGTNFTLKGSGWAKDGYK